MFLLNFAVIFSIGLSCTKNVPPKSLSSTAPVFSQTETVLSNPRLEWERYVSEEHPYITWSHRWHDSTKRGGAGSVLYSQDTELTDALIERISRMWNTIYILPNLKIQTADELQRLRRAKRGTLALIDLDVNLLKHCPDGSLGYNNSELMLNGEHVIDNALFHCNPKTRFYFEKVKRIDVPLGKPRSYRLGQISVDASLDKTSVLNLKSFTGSVEIRGAAFPNWLTHAVLNDSKWATLTFSDLTALSDSEAQHLSGFHGKRLTLPNLAALSAQSARFIATGDKLKFLALPRLKSIQPEAMEHLTSTIHEIELGIEKLTPAVAGSIRGDEKDRITLEKVTHLSRAAIFMLQPVERRLRFGLLEDLSLKEYEAFVHTIAKRRYKGQQRWLRTKRIDLAQYNAFDELFQQSGFYKRINWMKPSGFLYSAEEIDPKLIAVLAEGERGLAPYRQSLKSLPQLSAEMVDVLLPHLATIDFDFDGVETIGEAALERLSTTTGNILLNGMPVLSEDQARLLAKSPAKSISLKGLQHISIEAIRELLPYQGDILLPRWIYNQFEAQPYVFHHGKIRIAVNRRLHPETLQYLNLARFRRIDLGALKVITQEQAANISRFAGEMITLSPDRISPEALNELATYKKGQIAFIDLSADAGRQIIPHVSAFQTGRLDIKLRENKGDFPFALLAPYKGNLYLQIIKAESTTEGVNSPEEHVQLLQLLKDFSGQRLGLNVGLLDEAMATAIVQTNYQLSISPENIDDAALEIFKKNPARRFSIWADRRELCKPAFSHIDNEYCMALIEEAFEREQEVLE